MGVSTGQVFQPKIITTVEPQKRESAWEQVLPNILSSVAQTAVNSYIKNKLTEGQQEQEMLAKGYTKNPDGSWNPPAGWISESSVPGVLQYGQGSATTGFMADPALKKDKVTSYAEMAIQAKQQLDSGAITPEQYQQRLSDIKQMHGATTGVETAPSIISGKVDAQGNPQPDMYVDYRTGEQWPVGAPRPSSKSGFGGGTSTQPAGGFGAAQPPKKWGLSPEAGGEGQPQVAQTFGAETFSPTNRGVSVAAPTTTAPIASTPSSAVSPATTVPTTTQGVVNQAQQRTPGFYQPQKTEVAKPSFEQDLAIKSWAVKNGMDPESLTAPQKQEALIDFASEKTKVQEEMKRAGIDIPTLAYQMRKGLISPNAKSIMGSSGSRAAVRPIIAGEVMRQIGEENAQADGVDWNKLTKEQQQWYKNNAYFDFDKLEANFTWENSPLRTKNIAFIDSITPRVKALELKSGKLPNTNFKSANELQKWFKTQVGDKAYTDYESLLTQVVQEANTALSGSATGSDLRINLEMQNLNSALSPAQLKAGLNNLNSALLARREALTKDAVPMPIILGKATDNEWATALNDFYNRAAERLVDDYKDHTDIRHPSDETVMKIIAENRKGGTSAPVATAAPTSSFKPMDLPSFYTEYAKQFSDKFSTEEGKNRVWADWLKYRKAMGLQ